MATSLPALPEVERLSSRVIRILGGNPGKFTLQGTNTYIVGQGPRRMLIDTGEGKPSWAESLKRVLKEENATLGCAILTHWHHDHVSGVPDLFAFSPTTKVYKNQTRPSDSEGQLDISDGQKFEVDGATLRAFHCPGHTVDHMALILEEEDAMFTGDNVLGVGTAVFEDLATYMDSLKRMATQFSGRAYPGHGPVIEDGKAKVLEYIKHRKEREDQILEVLARSNPDGTQGWTSMQIVKVVYKDVPENLHQPAERGVLQVLKKLEKEGRVIHVADSDRWVLNGKATL
ncbi:uncharacterized protein K452DRAFT_266438 [Aplosporella prunicola CBS 121167]|uniref:Metallo-beta-lactamase domain-containing protein n=1 Tax=Aplosporella prunicola CBS 121167 TaxID=1176127 RepID=A0A6A6BMP8_9PEZI|nr:uncharacterized protein K452DRAFT_266438 [Aplosporella prunicola CBS 121167]KAF2144535.1 hypothetical protein K452DRAFT_266438 [Aplosporella prunicola CBS 121167]